MSFFLLKISEMFRDKKESPYKILKNKQLFLRLSKHDIVHFTQPPQEPAVTEETVPPPFPGPGRGWAGALARVPAPT